MHKKKLLIAGGGYAEIPLIEAAKRLGYHVITSGNRPDELGHQYSDEYHPADFSDQQAILDMATRLDIDAICPCCNDFSAISCAFVADKLSLPGYDSYETTLILHHKDRYREFALKSGIPSPKAKGFSDPDSAMSAVKNYRFPFIVKPVDLTGGKGIAKVEDPERFEQSINQAFSISKSSRIVVEEFLEGTKHGFSAFLRDGNVVFHFSDDEYYFQNPYLVSAASTPTSASQEAISDLIKQSEHIAQLLDLGTGVFHVQFIMHEGKPVIIEICRRPPGDLYVKLVEHATGLDYSEWIVKGFCGDPCKALSQHDVRGNFLRHCIMANKPGTLRGIEYDSQIRNQIIDLMEFWSAGDIVENHLVTKFGVAFLEFDSFDEMSEKSRAMQQLIRADISRSHP